MGEREIVEIKCPNKLTLRTGVRNNFFEQQILEKWYHAVLPVGSLEGPSKKPSCIYHTDADILLADPCHAERFLQCGGEREWYLLGARILTIVGWRPDCSAPHTRNIVRAVPPAFRSGHPIIFGAPDATKVLDKKVAAKIYEFLENESGAQEQCFRVEIQAFLEDGVGMLTAYTRDMRGTVTTAGWIMGLTVMDHAPVFLWESALYEALQQVERYLQANENVLTLIAIKAGDYITVSRMCTWFNDGLLGLQSAAASGIVEICDRLVDILPCPLFCMWTEGAVPAGRRFVENLDDARDILAVTRRRMVETILECVSEERPLAAIPMTKDEIKELILEKFCSDEIGTIEALKQAGSMAGGIFSRLQLDRTTIKLVLKELQASRQTQSTFCSILCATRFKYYEEKECRETLCQRPGCGKVDSFDHLLECTKLGSIPTDTDELIEFLVELSKKARYGNPGLPVPHRPLEIFLDAVSESETSTSSDNTHLSFERGD